MKSMKHPVNLGALASLLSLAALVVVGGCKPEISGELGEPFDKIEGMAGTWQLTAFTQQDLNSPVKEIGRASCRERV